MRVQYIRIDKYDWDLYVYYCITRTPINDIIEKLIDINCPSSYIKEAYTILSQNRENIGFTYSNASNRTSIIVLGRTNSPNQFINSFVHEITHLQSHISKTCGLNSHGEDVCYLAGYIAQTMFEYCNDLITDNKL